MEAATPRAQPTPQDGDLLVCLAAIWRALHTAFRPRLFLDELSTALRSLVPHDRLDIGYLAEDRRTFSVFAEHGIPGFLPRRPAEAHTERAESRGLPLSAVDG